MSLCLLVLVEEKHLYCAFGISFLYTACMLKHMYQGSPQWKDLY